MLRWLSRRKNEGPMRGPEFWHATVRELAFCACRVIRIAGDTPTPRGLAEFANSMPLDKFAVDSGVWKGGPCGRTFARAFGAAVASKEVEALLEFDAVAGRILMKFPDGDYEARSLLAAAAAGIAQGVEFAETPVRLSGAGS